MIVNIYGLLFGEGNLKNRSLTAVRYTGERYGLAAWEPSLLFLNHVRD